MRAFHRIVSFTSATVLVAVLAASVQAAGFVKFQSVDGEPRDASHKGEIDLIAWSHANTADPVIPRAPRAQRREPGDLSLPECTDAAGVGITEACAKDIDLRSYRFEMYQRTPTTHYPLGRGRGQR